MTPHELATLVAVLGGLVCICYVVTELLTRGPK